MILLIIIAVVLTAVTLVLLRDILVERLMWNNGRCPHCNYPWRYYITDNSRGRGYTCDKCGATVWISHNSDTIKPKDECEEK